MLEFSFSKDSFWLFLDRFQGHDWRPSIEFSILKNDSISLETKAYSKFSGRILYKKKYLPHDGRYKTKAGEAPY
jgi:hypothetical protein